MLKKRTKFFEGQLKTGSTAIPIVATYASKFSIFITSNDGQPLEGAFQSLTLFGNKKEIAFGLCSIASVDHDEYPYRLIFTDDVYDIKKLFEEQKTSNLNDLFHNLPLILSQKQRISSDFRNFVANASYDLSVYRNFFDSLEREIRKEPKEVFEKSEKAIIRKEGPKFFEFFDNHLRELELLVSSYSKEEHERHGYYLRRQVWGVILSADIMTRTNIKPRGYAGDSQMMQQLYRFEYEGDSIFGKLMHWHVCKSRASQAVRNRRKLIPEVLRSVQKGFDHLPERGFRIMSLACGPAWEMQDLFEEGDDFQRYHLTLLDQDQEALDEAKSGILNIEKTKNSYIDVNYINESVRTMLKTPNLHEKWGQYHFIYSMGLFDYLTPPVAKAVSRKMFELLEPGGTLLIGNYHVGHPDITYMEYWLDWVLYYRTEKDFLDFFEDEPRAEVTVGFEESNCQIFLQVEKKYD